MLPLSTILRTAKLIMNPGLPAARKMEVQGLVKSAYVINLIRGERKGIDGAYQILWDNITVCTVWYLTAY